MLFQKSAARSFPTHNSYQTFRHVLGRVVVCTFARWEPVGDKPLKASTLYRVAAILLLLFAIGHTLGFRQSDPHWGVDTMLASMRSIHFDVQGSDRTYWDLFLGAGFSVGVLYLFAALLAWQLGGLPPQALRQLRPVGWTFAFAFAALTVVSWLYLFIVPVIFSAAITVSLASAAWLSSRKSVTV